MKEFMLNTISEFEKLITKPGIKMYLYAAALLPIIFALIAAKVQTNDMISLSALNISFSILNIFLMMILPLFIFMTNSDQFSGEWDRGTLFPVRPINRLQLFLSKYAASAVLIAIQLGIIWFSSILSTWFFEKNLEAHTVWSSFIAVLVSIIPLLALMAFSNFLAQWFKSTSAAITVNVLIYIAMIGLPFIYPNAMYLFPSSYLDWYIQWQENVNILRISQSLIYLFSFSSLFLAAGYYMFNRKEL